ncbi:unnamed protein product [Amoebophrya sp. A120]|nr:unnamed protein product [Amoebophrya sp. A120]|eukprot:GSA120T00002368001.1
MTAPTASSSSSGPSQPSNRFLHYEGANHFRQRLVLSTLSGRPILIKQIRTEDRRPGLRDYESNFIRLLDKITDGAKIQINNTGTQLRYEPGQLVGCKDRVIVHECPASRSLGYWLEALALLLPFARNLTKLKLVGVTNDGTDLSVDSFRSVTLPWLRKMFAPQRYVQPEFGEQMSEKTTNNTALNGTVPQQNVYLHTNQTNFATEQLTFQVLRRGCGRASAEDDAVPATKGEVLFHCPTLARVRPLNLIEDFRCKRVRGVAFTSGVTPQYATRMCDAARGLLNDFLPDVWIFADHDKPAEKGKKTDDEGVKSRGFGLSLVAESVDGTYKSIDVFSNGDLSATEKAMFEEAATAADSDAEMSDSSENDEHGDDNSERKNADKTKERTAALTKEQLQDVPFALGKAGACRLLSELALGGCVDTTHQVLLLHYVALAEEDEASRVRVGKLTPTTIEYLRHMKDFFNVEFKMRQQEDDSVVLSCVGVGLANLSRPTF